MQPIAFPQMLLIAGTGRNTGKTTLACDIIRKFGRARTVIALKITPHFHKNVQSGHVIIDSDSLYIAEETDPGTGKDSSLMLLAGARKSYFVMTADTCLAEAWKTITRLIPAGSLVVCESGGLRSHILPGLFFMMSGPGPDAVKPATENRTTEAAAPTTAEPATENRATAAAAQTTVKPAKVKPATEKLKLLADRVITFDGKKIDFDPDEIEIADNQWKLKQESDDTI